MLILNFIVPACWIIFLLYWIVSAQKAKRTVETKGLLRGNFYRIFMVIGYTLYLNPRLPKPFDFLSVHLLSQSTVLIIICDCIVISGLAVAIIARRKLASNWSGAITFKENHELITGGIYHYARHPIYTGLILMFTGTTLFYCSGDTIAAFIIMIIAIIYKINLEEKMMLEHFPESYPQYKKKVKAVIPFLI